MPKTTLALIALSSLGAALNLVTALRTGDPWRYGTALALAAVAGASWKASKQQKAQEK